MPQGSKGPSGPARGLGEGLTRGPDQYRQLRRHHEIGQDRKAQEAHATVASRALTDPMQSGSEKPALVKGTDWLKRHAQATYQKLSRMFGRYGELTPDGTVTVSTVQPVARSFGRTSEAAEQTSEASQRVSSKTELSKGVAVQHSVRPGVTPDGVVKSPASPTPEYAPSAAIRAYYALGDARRAELGQPQRWRAEIEPVASRNQAMGNALKAKGQISKPRMPGKMEKSQGNDIGRDIDD